MGGATAPADDDTDPMAAGAADTGADDQEMDDGEDDAAPADENEPRVLCTIMDNRDGTYQLIKGDEGEAGGEDALSGEAAEGMPPAAGGVASQPEGESFDAPGPLLKAVLDILKDAEEQGDGSADDNLQAGFAGPKEPQPKAY